MKPDLIVTWPKNADYPLWRQMVRDERDKFNNVIVVFMETNQGFDYREFVKEAMQKDYILFMDSPPIPAGDDWRNVAVNAGLQQSVTSELIWFTEQDFYPRSSFWPACYDLRENDVIGVKDGKGLHPCSLIMNRKALSTISRNFAVIQGVGDHFSLVQKEIEESDLKVGIVDPKHYIHMNGLSHNLTLITNGELPNWQPEQFKSYAIKTLQVKVPLNDRYKEIMSDYLKRDQLNRSLPHSGKSQAKN